MASIVMKSGTRALKGNLSFGSWYLFRACSSFLICFEENESTCNKGRNVCMLSG